MPCNPIERANAWYGTSGRSWVASFGANGWRVGLISRDEDRLHDAKRNIDEAGGEGLVLPCDVADAPRVFEARDRVVAKWGRVDVWVNCAMATVVGPVVDVTPDEYRRVTEVTYLGAVHGTLAALEVMRPRNRGSIIQVGSALAYRAIPLQSAYCGAKHAIRGFTDALRCELLHDHSRVHLTMVQMPALNTPQFDWAENRMPHAPQPVAPVFQPEVAARAIVWAATHRRREVYVGISTVKAIVANQVVPGWLDRYLGRTGYQAQQRAAPASDAAPSNLWQPVAGAHRVHGPFDGEAKRYSSALWLDTHRPLALAAVLSLAALTWRRWPRR
jgi:short-subunit dehydrogenase